MLTREQLEARALADYRAYAGEVIEVEWIFGIRDSDSVDIYFDPPIRVLVDTTDKRDILHWCMEWLDPLWNVTPQEEHPALAGIPFPWIYGISYHPGGMTQPNEPFQILTPA